MKNVIKNWPLFIALGLVLSFSSCTKKADTSPADNSVSASDINTVSNAITANADDAAITADGNYSRGANGADPWGVTLCGGTVVTDTNTKTTTVTYDGTTVCNGVIRAGVVTITLSNGDNWKAQGAVITVATTGLKITDAVTEANFTIAGSHTINNESGGILADLVTTPNSPIIRRHTGSLEITYPNGSTRSWSFDRTRKWSTFTADSKEYLNVSLYTEANNNVSETGYDRFNQNFTNKINVPIQSDNYKCDLIARWNPYSGERSHNINNRTVTVDFGTDASGNVVGTQTYCPSVGNAYGYYITYVNSNDTVTRHKFISYWLR